MRRLYLLLMALLKLGASGAWADTTYSIQLGDYITSSEEIEEGGLYVLQNKGEAGDGRASYIQYNPSDYKFYFSTYYDQNCVYVAHVSEGTFTFQLYTDRTLYIPTLQSATQMTASTTAGQYTLVDPSDAGYFYLRCNSLNMNRATNSDASSGYVPAGYTTGGTGNYARTRIYKATATATPNILESKYYLLRNDYFETYLNASLTSTSSADGVEIFQLTPDGEGYYTIKATSTNQFVKAAKSTAMTGATDATTVILTDETTGDGIKWKIDVDGTYLNNIDFISKGEPTLGLIFWTGGTGKPVGLYDKTNGGAVWSIVEISAEQYEAFQEYSNIIPLLQTNQGLVTEASQWTSNNGVTWEGGSYASLLDNDASTYYMTDWYYSVTGNPYIEATLPEPVNSFYLYFVTPPNWKNAPTAMTLSAFNSATSEWIDQSVDFGTLPSTAGTSYIKKISLSDAYSQLRFTVTNNADNGTNSTSSDYTFFGLAEFYILPSNDIVDEAVTLLQNLPSNAVELTSEQISYLTTAQYHIPFGSYVLKNDIRSKLAKANNIGYPSGTNEYVVSLNGLITVYDGNKYSITEAMNTNLQSWYSGMLSADIVTPPAGFYKIYYPVSAEQKKYVTVTGSVPTATVSVPSETSSIWYYDSIHLIAYSNGYQVKGNASGNEVMQVGDKTVTFSKSNVSSTFGYMNVTPYGCSPWYVTPDASDYVLNRWSGGSQNGQQFQVEAVTTLPVTFVGEYASFYSPVDLTIPEEDVEVYTGTLNGDWLTLNAVTGTLPANTGVILRRKSSETTTVNFTVLSTVTPGTSALTGTVAAATAVEGGVLVLGKSDNVWGIYNYTGALGGFKAYMEMPDSEGEVKGLRFDFGGTATGITAAEVADRLNGAVYNLAGQRVQQPARGLYIVSGKKVLVK